MYNRMAFDLSNEDIRESIAKKISMNTVKSICDFAEGLFKITTGGIKITNLEGDVKRHLHYFSKSLYEVPPSTLRSHSPNFVAPPDLPPGDLVSVLLLPSINSSKLTDGQSDFTLKALKDVEELYSAIVPHMNTVLRVVWDLSYSGDIRGEVSKTLVPLCSKIHTCVLATLNVLYEHERDLEVVEELRQIYKYLIENNILKVVDNGSNTPMCSDEPTVADVRSHLVNQLNTLESLADSKHPIALIWDIPYLISHINQVANGHAKHNSIDHDRMVRLTLPHDLESLSGNATPLIFFYNSKEDKTSGDLSSVIAKVKALLRVILIHRSGGLPTDWSITVNKHSPVEPLYGNLPSTGPTPLRKMGRESLIYNLNRWCDSVGSKDHNFKPTFHIPDHPNDTVIKGRFSHGTDTDDKDGCSSKRWLTSKPLKPVVNVYLVDVASVTKPGSHVSLVHPSLSTGRRGVSKITYRSTGVVSIRARKNDHDDALVDEFKSVDLFL